MSYQYSQATGDLTLDGEFIATGYSGRGSFRNEPYAQDLKFMGPIPRGWYTIGPEHTGAVTGPISLPLEPDAANDMHGRGGFLIHGDDAAHDASEGCIILSHQARARIAFGEDRRLEVV